MSQRGHVVGGGELRAIPGDPSGRVLEASSGAKMPYIILIDPRPLTRESLVRLLATSATDFIVLPVSAAEVLGDAFLTEDSIVVLNVGYAGLSDGWVGREIHAIAARLPETPLIVLCDSEDVSQVVRALACGVRGYIPTTFSPPVAVEAIRFVHAGGTFIPASALEQAANDHRNGHVLPPAARKPSQADAAATDELVMQPEILRVLTPRQQQVLRALCEGQANKKIAYDLNLQEGTVKVHVRQIMRKLKAKNRTQVALLASGLPAGAGNPGGAGCGNR